MNRTRLETPDVWRTLCPALHVEDARLVGGREIVDLAEDALGDAVRWMHKEGYVQLHGILPQQVLGELAVAIARIRQVGLPPVFVFVYDEAWAVFRVLHRLWEALLEPEYAFLPSFWAWYVPADYTGRGWGPHRDGDYSSLLAGGVPGRISTWLPLTPATPVNGCMHVVPMHLDPGSIEALDLQNLRALPAVPGDVLVWNHAVYHWSGRSSTRGAVPRVSISVELTRSDVRPDDLPLVHPFAPPPFEARLGLIGKQILKYDHMERPTDTWMALARTLQQRWLVGGPPAP